MCDQQRARMNDCETSLGIMIGDGREDVSISAICIWGQGTRNRSVATEVLVYGVVQYRFDSSIHGITTKRMLHSVTQS